MTFICLYQSFGSYLSKSQNHFHCLSGIEVFWSCGGFEAGLQSEDGFTFISASLEGPVPQDFPQRAWSLSGPLPWAGPGLQWLFALSHESVPNLHYPSRQLLPLWSKAADSIIKPPLPQLRSHQNKHRKQFEAIAAIAVSRTTTFLLWSVQMEAVCPMLRASELVTRAQGLC